MIFVQLKKKCVYNGMGMLSVIIEEPV